MAAAKKGSSAKGKSASAASQRRAVKKAVRTAKKHPKAVIAVAVILVIVIAVGAVLYLKNEKVHNAIANLISGKNANSLSGGTNSFSVGTYGDDDLSFHFLELGNNNTGDSTYIKAGDVDILIDAGSKRNSADDIESYVDRYCTDGKLEYVIATHAHEDHIAGFTNSSGMEGIFAHYECEVIIDFPRTDSNAKVYQDYVSLRDQEIAENEKHRHYTALQCWNNEGGAQREYLLGEGMKMSILYQKFYEQNAGTENNYSVCVLFTHGDKHFLFTGDLEAAGETSLVESNDLPQVELFKAGHHGSETSSNSDLLSVIKPKIVCVCCCAGSVEYQNNPKVAQNMNNTFPTQSFVNRVGIYTDKIYVTTVSEVEYNEGTGRWYNTGTFSSMNGNITVLSSKGEVTVTCSNNTLLKDTEWFKANRQPPTDGWASAG